MSNLAFRILNIRPFVLHISQYINNYVPITEMLKSNIIPFDSYIPTACIDPVFFEISFTKECNLLDVYLLADTLKDFGLKQVWPSQADGEQILIASNLYDDANKKYHFIKPLSIAEFLKIPPRLDTSVAIEKCFKERYNDIQIELLGTSEYDEHDNSYFEVDHDWKRETFDAMTDGQLGDYDDYNGDIDDVMTWAGRD